LRKDLSFGSLFRAHPEQLTISPRSSAATVVVAESKSSERRTAKRERIFELEIWATPRYVY